MRRLSADARSIALIVAGIAVLFSDVLFFGAGFFFRDVMHENMPSRFVVREVLLRYHELPLWNPWFSAGQPLAANPAFQAFYPGSWLAFLPNFRWGFDFEVVAHVALAAVGMFLLLRELELRPESAAFGSVAFALGGAILSLTNLLPHLTSVAWWPLIVRSVLRVLRRGTFREAALLALMLGMMFLCAEQAVMIQTAILVAAVVIAERGRIARVPLLAAACVVALLIAAVQLGPALEVKNESKRRLEMPMSAVYEWSMPIDRPLELFWPHAHGTMADDGGHYAGFARYGSLHSAPLITDIYCGLAIPLLFLAGVFTGARWRGWAVALVAISYLMAIGGNGPPMRWLYAAGLFRTIRFPEKYVILGLFAMIVFASIVIDQLKPRFVLLILALTLADLLVYFNEIVPRKPAHYFDPPPIANVLAVTRGRSRVFWRIEWPSPGGTHALRVYRAVNGLLPYSNALYGIASVCERDITGTAQIRTALFVDLLWNVAARTHTTAPMLAMANTEFVVAPGPIEHPIEFVRLPLRPRYEFADQIATVRGPDDFLADMTKGGWSDRIAFIERPAFVPAAGDVLRVDERPTAIDLDVRAAGRALLQIRNTFHHNWHATIDGRDAALQPANVAFTALEVPAGAHHVALRYRDPLMALCAAVSLIALIAAIIGALQRAR